MMEVAPQCRHGQNGFRVASCEGSESVVGQAGGQQPLSVGSPTKGPVDGRTFEVATSPDLRMGPVEPVLSGKGPRRRRAAWLASPTGKMCCIAQTKRYCKDSVRT